MNTGGIDSPNYHKFEWEKQYYALHHPDTYKVPKDNNTIMNAVCFQPVSNDIFSSSSLIALIP